MQHMIIHLGIPFLRALNSILAAAVSITAFSMLLFAFTYIRREKLTDVFLAFLLCIATIYAADVLETTAEHAFYKMIWQKIHWSGFLFLPAVFYHFSDVLQSMTGLTKTLKRKISTLLIYACSGVFAVLLWNGQLFRSAREIPLIGAIIVPTKLMNVCWIYIGFTLILTMIKLALTYQRTRTRTSRRRMAYLIISSFGILIGTFPLLIFGSGVLSQHAFLFWILSVFANLVVSLLVFLLAYSVTTFSAAWSYREARLKMIEWILRGPAVASLTLAITTIINRGATFLGLNIAGMSSLAQVVSIVLFEFLITLFLPRIQRNSIAGYGMEDYLLVSGFENMMVYKSELQSYLEALLGALCDKFQADSGFVAVLDAQGKIELLIKEGEALWPEMDAIRERISQNYAAPSTGQAMEETILLAEEGLLRPIFNHDNGRTTLLAIIGIATVTMEKVSAENRAALQNACEKSQAILWRRYYLNSTLQTLHQSAETEMESAKRKSSMLNQSAILEPETRLEVVEVSSWVKDALTHFWGGPKLSGNPLLKLRLVKEEIEKGAENPIIALRAVLKKAIEYIRPQGTRAYTGEWVLYNILSLKFIEGMKVKDVAKKLAMSEADLYRKQKVAIEEIAKIIIEMENNEKGDSEKEKTESPEA